MLSTIHSIAINGRSASRVLIEVNVSPVKGPREPVYIMVGLPDNAVKESKTRVRSAMENSGYGINGAADIAVNFAPADVKKEGSGYDLPLAIGILQTHDLLRIEQEQMERCLFLGELGLNGDLRPVRGVLPAAILARRLGYEAIFVPEENAREAAVVDTLQVFGAGNLRQVVAAGGHNLLLVGSPGCGKSMMAKRLPSILPPLSLAESLETTQIHSVAGKLQRNDTLISTRPFRAPHHTISDVALIGGGGNIQPGEVSLAHNGVLFLDEFPEFSKNALETLRQPLEDRHITISRAKYTATLPCSMMLIAAMNPCPCGYYNDPSHECSCRPGQVQRYMSRISGPLLDRIDLQVEVTPVPVKELSTAPEGESSAEIRARVIAARERQTARFAQTPRVHCNAQMEAPHIREFVHLDDGARQSLETAMNRLNLSARAYERILKVALTIADLAASDVVTSVHIAEAVSYRNLDRSTWGE